MSRKNKLKNLGVAWKQLENKSKMIYSLTEEELEKYYPIGEVFLERSFYIVETDNPRLGYMYASSEWIDIKRFYALLNGSENDFNKVFSFVSELSKKMCLYEKPISWLLFINPFNQGRYIYSVREGCKIYSIIEETKENSMEEQ